MLCVIIGYFLLYNIDIINYKIGLFYKVIEIGDLSDYDYGLTFDYNIRFLDMNSFSTFFLKESFEA